jgi:integrase
VLAKAGIKPLRVHDIRHTFASHAALESENTTTIAKLLGHRMTRTTERYMHLGDKPAIEAAEMVSIFLAAALNGRPIPFANEGEVPRN